MGDYLLLRTLEMCIISIPSSNVYSYTGKRKHNIKVMKKSTLIINLLIWIFTFGQLSSLNAQTTDSSKIMELLHFGSSPPDIAKSRVKKARELIYQEKSAKKRKAFEAEANLVLSQLMWRHTKEFEEADSLAYLAYTQFIELENWHKAGWACIFKGCTHYYSSREMDSALYWTHKAIDLAEMGGKPQLFIIGYGNLTRLLLEMGKIEDALNTAHLELKYSEQLNDSAHLASAYSTMGYLNHYLDDLQAAESYYRKAYSHAQIDNLWWDLKITIFNQYAQILQARGKIQESADVFYEVLKLTLNKEYDKECFSLVAYTGIGNALMENEGWEKAEEYFNKSTEISDRTGAKPAFHLVSLAKVYSLMGKTDAALELVEEFLKYHEQLNPEIDYYKDISLVYEKAGMTEKALEYFKKWSLLSDSIRSSENTRLLANMERRYVVEKKDREIAEQKLALSQNRLSLSKSQSRQILLGWLLLLVLIAGILYVVRIRQNVEREKQRYQLQMKQNQLKHVLAAQEKERKRIARELHDGIGQSLAALKIQLQAPRSGLLASVHRIDTLCREVRSLSHQMMPLILEEKGLDEALSVLVEQCFETSKVNAHFVCSGFQDRLDSSLETHLYRVGQELLYNIIKHADATDVGVQLLQNDKRIVLIVEDNGKGFLQSEQSNGIGLNNIQSRLEALEGRMEIHSSEKGTFVRVTVPLTKENKISA